MSKNSSATILATVAASFGPIAAATTILSVFMATILLRSRLVTSLQNLLYLHMAISNSIFGLVCIFRLVSVLTAPHSPSPADPDYAGSAGSHDHAAHLAPSAGTHTLTPCYQSNMFTVIQMTQALSLATLAAIAGHHRLTASMFARAHDQHGGGGKSPRTNTTTRSQSTNRSSPAMSCIMYLWSCVARRSHAAPWLILIWLFAIFMPMLLSWLIMTDAGISSHLALLAASDGSLSLASVAHEFLCLTYSEAQQLIQSGKKSASMVNSNAGLNVALAGIIEALVWGTMSAFSLSCYNQAFAAMSAVTPSRITPTSEAAMIGARGPVHMPHQPLPSHTPPPWDASPATNETSGTSPSSGSTASATSGSTMSSTGSQFYNHHQHATQPLMPFGSHRSYPDADRSPEDKSFESQAPLQIESLSNALRMSIPGITLMAIRAVIGAYQTVRCMLSRPAICQPIFLTSPTLVFVSGPIAGAIYAFSTAFIFFVLNRRIRRATFVLFGIVSSSKQDANMANLSSGSRNAGSSSSSSISTAVSSTLARFMSSGSPFKQSFMLRQPPQPETYGPPLMHPRPHVHPKYQPPLLLHQHQQPQIQPQHQQYQQQSFQPVHMVPLPFMSTDDGSSMFKGPSGMSNTHHVLPPKAPQTHAQPQGTLRRDLQLSKPPVATTLVSSGVITAAPMTTIAPMNDVHARQAIDASTPGNATMLQREMISKASTDTLGVGSWSNGINYTSNSVGGGSAYGKSFVERRRLGTDANDV